MRFGGAPDRFVSHTCVSGSNPADPVWRLEKYPCFPLLVTTRSREWRPSRVKVDVHNIAIVLAKSTVSGYRYGYIFIFKKRLF